MGHWGWRRLLFVFMLVWVVGCETRRPDTPSTAPTQYPPVTLIVRTPRTSIPPLTTAAATSTTLDLPATDQATPSTITEESPQTLAPSCYGSIASGLLCLGLVKNTLEEAVTRVAVRVDLFDSTGTLAATQITAVQQRYIAPGTSAPYRALFTGLAEGLNVTGVMATLQRAERIGEAVPLLEIESVRGEMENGRYVVAARVSNPGPEAIKALHAIVTLQDPAGRVVGYRAVQVEGDLPPGESRSLQVTVMPLVVDTTYTHTLVVEALE